MPASAPVYSSPKILFNGNAAPQRVTFAPLAIPSDGRDLFLAIETLSTNEILDIFRLRGLNRRKWIVDSPGDAR